MMKKLIFCAFTLFLLLGGSFATALESNTGWDWLYAEGNRIVDENGQEVWLTGLNWFGYNTGTNAFDGLWAANLGDTVAAIADHGFNIIRVPVSTELLKSWSMGEYPAPNINYAVNPSLEGKNSLEVFDVFLVHCEANGLKVMIDIHSAHSDPMGHMANLWYDEAISTADYYSALYWVARRYRKNDTIVAYDLKNEPHGKPDESARAVWNAQEHRNNWKYVAEKAAAHVLKGNPNALIVVEGIEIYPKDVQKNANYASKDSGDYHFAWWGANLRGVRDYPIDLGKYQNKLIYSPHDYGPSVYQQPWFSGSYSLDSLMKDYWRDTWFFIHEEEIAPLFIGEWGGHMTETNLPWMTHLRTLIGKYRLHHTFWCLNPNSGDTGGLLLDDFITWDEEKTTFVQAVLWQEDGAFIGLDAEVPLGSHGTTRPIE